MTQSVESLQNPGGSQYQSASRRGLANDSLQDVLDSVCDCDFKRIPWRDMLLCSRSGGHCLSQPGIIEEKQRIPARPVPRQIKPLPVGCRYEMSADFGVVGRDGPSGFD